MVDARDAAVPAREPLPTAPPPVAPGALDATASTGEDAVVAAAPKAAGAGDPLTSVINVVGSDLSDLANEIEAGIVPPPVEPAPESDGAGGYTFFLSRQKQPGFSEIGKRILADNTSDPMMQEIPMPVPLLDSVAFMTARAEQLESYFSLFEL